MIIIIIIHMAKYNIGHNEEMKTILDTIKRNES